MNFGGQSTNMRISYDLLICTHFYKIVYVTNQKDTYIISYEKAKKTLAQAKFAT